MYFKKRQSSEPGGTLKSTLPLIPGLSALRNGVLGAVPIPAWRHSEGCSFANWIPGVCEGSWGSLNLWTPVLLRVCREWINVLYYGNSEWNPYPLELRHILIQGISCWSRYWLNPEKEPLGTVHTQGQRSWDWQRKLREQSNKKQWNSMRCLWKTTSFSSRRVGWCLEQNLLSFYRNTMEPILYYK